MKGITAFAYADNAVLTVALPSTEVVEVGASPPARTLVAESEVASAVDRRALVQSLEPLPPPPPPTPTALEGRATPLGTADGGAVEDDASST